MIDPAWVLSVSIDEEVRWAIKRIRFNPGSYLSMDDPTPTIGKRLFDIPPNKTTDMHHSLLKCLLHLRETDPRFANISAVGVSSVGVVDNDRKILVNFDRKRWVLHSSDDLSREYIIDFQFIFSSLFGDDVAISIQNDATAKALAEYEHIYSEVNADERPEVLCYANFHAGVNAGYVRKTSPKLPWASKPVSDAFHQEVGHTCAPAPPNGLRFNVNNTGCPVHKTCFVGVVSNTRIQREWGRQLSQISCDDDEPWNERNEIAFYISHFLHNSILNVAPDKILLAGDVIFPELIPYVRRFLDERNSYNGRRYIDYKSLSDKNFVDSAKLTVNEAGVMGGLELARRALHKHVHRRV